MTAAARPHPRSLLQRSARLARGLALACHPLPALAVTVLTAGLAAEAGTTVIRATLITMAMLAGQLSIGWCNDAIDAERDRAVRRTDKPVAKGLLSVRATWAAAASAAAALTVAAPLGWGAFTVLTLAVACGWAYDLGVKATVWSWLPYAAAFGALPGIATLASSHPRWPAGWAVAAGALFGVAAHFANVLPDLLDDEATGVRGLPHALGPRVSAVTGPILLLAASVSIMIGPASHGHVALRAVGLLSTTLAAAWAALAALRDPRSRRYFLAVIAIALLDLALFALWGRSI
ncbi:MAG: UbiA family prenyltransferase [Actinomycetota bacterium]|nr:UbiA family prenyltransferase [Actinomycetota bacterium]